MEELIKNREGYLVGKYQRQCTNCKAVFNKTSKTVALCPTCNSARVKSQSAEYKMLARAKMRAKKQNVPFEIGLEDLIIPTTCPILNIPLVVHKGKSGTFSDSPSLDKINPKKGYVKGNIMIISSLANSMKYTSTPEQMIKFAEWILKTYKNSAED